MKVQTILKDVMLSVLILLSATVFGYAPRTYDVKSEAMDKTVSVTVLLPRGYDEHPERRYSVVYLLHGAGDTDMHAYHPLLPGRPKTLTFSGKPSVMPTVVSLVDCR